LGKKAGADLREGKLTLPVIAALAAAPAADRERMQAIIVNPDFSQDDFETLKTDLNHHGGLAYARQCAESHVAQAKAALDVFDSSPTIDILRDIADYTLSRQA
jgi:octaprenyl-diphosphate synthase